MKNKHFIFFGLPFLLVALISISCEQEPENKSTGASGKFRFTNAVAAPYQNVSRSVIDNGDGSFYDQSSFAEYANIYTHANIGNKIRNITPTKLEIDILNLRVFGYNGNKTASVNLINQQTKIDIVQGILLQPPGLIPVGKAAIISFSAFFQGNVSIPWPAEMIHLTQWTGGPSYGTTSHNIVSGLLNIETQAITPSGVNLYWLQMYREAGNGGLTANGIFDDKNNNGIWDSGERELPQFASIVYGGNTRKMHYGEYKNGPFDLRANDIIPSFPLDPMSPSHFQVIGGGVAGVVIPWAGFDITENTNSVTFEIRWNLTDIIEQYSGPDGIADTADDIFILKNDFWKALSITASSN